MRSRGLDLGASRAASILASGHAPHPKGRTHDCNDRPTFEWIDAIPQASRAWRRAERPSTPLRAASGGAYGSIDSRSARRLGKALVGTEKRPADRTEKHFLLVNRASCQPGPSTHDPGIPVLHGAARRKPPWPGQSPATTVRVTSRSRLSPQPNRITPAGPAYRTPAPPPRGRNRRAAPCARNGRRDDAGCPAPSDPPRRLDPS